MGARCERPPIYGVSLTTDGVLQSVVLRGALSVATIRWRMRREVARGQRAKP